MKAVILAGGAGTRLRSVVSDVPKPMADINGRPFLECLIEQLKRWNIKDIVLLVGYKAGCIVDYFGDGKKFGVNIFYSEEIEPLGTGGALKQAENFLTEDYFIMMNGDSYFDINFHKLITMITEKKYFGILSLFKIKNSERYGSVIIDEDSRVLRFLEKQKSVDDSYVNVNGGIYALSSKILEYIPPRKCSLENDIFPEIIKNEEIYSFISDGFFIDIGIPEDYFRLKNTKDLF